MNRPLIIAHRGMWTDPVEQNTLPAFKRAIESGVDGIEMDLRMTKDGILVLSHDRRIQTGDTRYHWIDKLSFAEYKQLAAPVRFDTLIEELAPILKKQHILLDLDFKQSHMEKQVALILKKHNLKFVLVSSPNIWTLREFELVMPEALTGLTYYPEDKWDLWENRAFRYLTMIARVSLKPFLFRLIRRKTRKNDSEVAGIQHKLINEKVISFLHQYNIKVFVWGTENEHRLRQLMEWGVDGIKTKNPPLVKALYENNFRPSASQ